MTSTRVDGATAMEVPRMDIGHTGWTFSSRISANTIVYYEHPEDDDYLPRIFRSVVLGRRFNSVWSTETCACGAVRRCLPTIRDISSGEEIVNQKDPVVSTGNRLLISFDGGGGGSKDANDDPIFVAGVVAYLYKQGESEPLLREPVICSASSSQQAEACGAVRAVQLVSKSVQAALDRNIIVTPPIVITGDSANTIAFFTGHARIKAPRLTKYFAGVHTALSISTFQIEYGQPVEAGVDMPLYGGRPKSEGYLAKPFSSQRLRLVVFLLFSPLLSLSEGLADVYASLRVCIFVCVYRHIICVHITYFNALHFMRLHVYTYEMACVFRRMFVSM